MSDYRTQRRDGAVRTDCRPRRPVAVDEGLRAYMLRIYNYMVLGLAITGLAALGIYLLSVTTDPTVAVLKLRDGLMLTGFGTQHCSSAR